MNFRILSMTLLPLSILLASAHPGHGLMEHGAGHVASSAYHLFVLAAVAAALLTVAQIVRNVVVKRGLRVAGVAALLAAGALWSLGL
jgi:hypothetical protein